MRPALIALLLTVLTGCGAPTAEQPRADENLTFLAKLMSGHFSSAAQAKEDGSYFDIRLAMVPMWQDREDGPWLYVEQAVARAIERPYRQRVYRLRRIAEGLYESRVYAIPDAKSRAGAWKEEAPLADLSPEDLEEKDGCGVVLRRRDDGTFAGGTLGMACRNTYGGAAYATSFVTVFEDRLEAWDRGYDAESKPVWGPDGGPYVFRRVEAPN